MWSWKPLREAKMIVSEMMKSIMSGGEWDLAAGGR